MRTSRRRAAVGATSLALLLAATGTSIAAVRASRYEADATGTSLALPVPNGGLSNPFVALSPTAGPVGGADGEAPAVPGPIDPSTGVPAPLPGSSPAPSTSPSGGGSPAAPSQGAGQSPGTPAGQGTGSTATGTTLGPATGPTPTSAPQHPSPTVPCPDDSAQGAPARAARSVDAANLVLPWPGLVGVVLFPQAAAARPAGAAVAISWADQGSIIGGGSGLTLPGPIPTSYVLTAEGRTDHGSIGFTLTPPAPVDIAQRGCRDRSLVIFSIGAAAGGNQLRIVGYAAPTTGAVSIDDGGGAAHFRASAAGGHRVTLLTAYDGGTAGPLVRVTITVS